MRRVIWTVLVGFLVGFLLPLSPVTGQNLGIITIGSTCNSFISINQTAATTVITGTAGNRIYVCAILLVSATAQNLSVTEGTGTVCATGATAIIGGTTASVAVAANGGYAMVSPGPFMVTRTVADNFCVLQSGVGNVSGMIAYSQQP